METHKSTKSDNDYYELGLVNVHNEDYEDAIVEFTRAIEINNKQSAYYLARANMYLLTEKYEKALSDIKTAISLDQGREIANETQALLRKCYEKIQKNESLDEHLLSYNVRINTLKENPDIMIYETVMIDQDFREMFAVMCLREEYGLLQKFFMEYGRKYIDDYLSPEFAWWQPTVLYYITCKKQRKMIKDLPKMIRFLVENGADPNIPAADGSTMLWNQCVDAFTDTRTMELLLELGADPNQLSTADDEVEVYPLEFCLMPSVDEDYNEEENNWKPYKQIHIDKANLLLKYGANPNLSSKIWGNFTPLVLAITYGPKTPENQNLVNMLIEKGAETDCIEISGLSTTVECMVKPGTSGEGTTTKYFSKEDIEQNNILQIEDHYIHITEKSELSLKGFVLFNESIQCGEFELNLQNISFKTGFINVCYDMVMNLTIDLSVELKQDSDVDEYGNQADWGIVDYDLPENFADLSPEMRKLFISLKKYIDFSRPSDTGRIDECNHNLKLSGFPELPPDYASFLLKMNGLAFNSIELFGDKIVVFSGNFILFSILQKNEMMKLVYGEKLKNRLIIGQDNEDYYIWNPETHHYEIHSHEYFDDIYNEWETFEELFVNQCGIYILNDDDLDDGRYDAWV